MKFITKVYGTGRASEYFAPNVYLETEEDLKVGDLVAINSSTNKLKKADEDNVPVGIVAESTPKGWGEAYEFEGERDNNVLKKGSHINLYKQFIVTGCPIKSSDISGLKVGQVVYLTGKTASAELTTTKPSTGFAVGIVERVTDQMVRFDLMLTAIPIATE